MPTGSIALTMNFTMLVAILCQFHRNIKMLFEREIPINIYKQLRKYIRSVEKWIKKKFWPNYYFIEKLLLQRTLPSWLNILLKRKHYTSMNRCSNRMKISFHNACSNDVLCSTNIIKSPLVYGDDGKLIIQIKKLFATENTCSKNTELFTGDENTIKKIAAKRNVYFSLLDHWMDALQ